MNKAKIILTISVAILAAAVLHLSQRITALERRAKDYDAHFGYKSQYPFVGLFGVQVPGGHVIIK